MLWLFRACRRFLILFVVVGLCGVGVWVGVAVADPVARGDLVARAEAGVQSFGEASVLAGSVGREVEVLSGAGVDRRVVALPRGGFRLESSAVPFRARQSDGSWANIDLGLVRVGERFEPQLSAVETSVSAVGSDRVVLRLGSGEDWFGFVWRGGDLGEPAVSGEFVTYSDVCPGVDLVVRVRVHGGSVNFVVKDRVAGERVVREGLSLGWQAGPGLGLVKRGGLLQVVRGDVVVHRFDSLLMWDSRANAGGGCWGCLILLRMLGCV